MDRKISVIIKEPGKAPRHVNISSSENNLEKTVGGQVDEHLLAADLVILTDRDQNGAECCEVCGLKLAGTVIFAGIGHPDPEGSDELTDLPIDFKTFKKLFPQLWN